MIGVGNFIDRFGQKKMMLIAATVLALAAFFNSFVQNMLMLAIGFSSSAFSYRAA